MKYANLISHYRRTSLIILIAIFLLTNCRSPESVTQNPTDCTKPKVKIVTEIPTTILAGEPFELKAQRAGSNLTFTWGDNEADGTFSNKNALATTYTPPMDVAQVTVTIQAESDCGNHEDSITLNVVQSDTPTPTITPTHTHTPTQTATNIPTPTSTPTPTPDMTKEFLATCTKDLTLANGASSPNSAVVGANFTITWILQNSGTCPWSDDLQWIHLEGEDFGYSGISIILDTEILVEQEITLTAELQAPDTQGVFSSTWQIINGEGDAFGDPVSFEFRTYVPAIPTPDVPPPNITKAEVLPGGALLLEWTWIRNLEPDEHLAVRLWPVGGEKKSVTWTRDHSTVIGITNEHFPEGDYFFNVAVVRGTGGENWELVVESHEIPVYVPNIEIPTDKGGGDGGNGSNGGTESECPPDC